MAPLPYRKDIERILKYLIDDNISFEKAYLMFRKDICDSGSFHYQ